MIEKMLMILVTSLTHKPPVAVGGDINTKIKFQLNI